MAYKIKNKKEKADTMRIIRQDIPRPIKERYLRNTGLFKQSAISEMSDDQLDEMVEVGLRVKGVIK